MADYHISDIYQGGYSSLNPNYGPLFTGYRAPIESIGTATSPFTINILKEVADKIAPGQKNIEVSLGIFPDRAPIEAVPKQYLKEVNRLSKLTGVDISVHGPLTDASGVSRQGFNEQTREIAERKIMQAVEKGHELNPDGNIPVTFHSANELPGAVYRKIEEEGKKKEVKEMMYLINQESGQMVPVRRDIKYQPIPRGEKTGEILPVEKGVEYTVEKQLSAINTTEWDNALQQLIIPKEHADRIIQEVSPIIDQIMQKQERGLPMTEVERQAWSRFSNAHEQLRDIETHLSSLFGRGYEYGDERTKKYFKEIAEKFREDVLVKHPKAGIMIENQNPVIFSAAMQKLMENLRIDSLHGRHLQAPQVYKPAEEYALEMSKKTFGNVAWESYKKYGSKSPIINIENPPAGFGLSRAKDLADLAEGSRKKFVENAVRKGMSESEAKRWAEKLIGVTWDVGHINQLRQFGFSSEDIIKEAEKVGHLVKHVHLSDNFGMENVELPMGMGNVDLKKVMEALKNKGTDVDKVKKIAETGHWWQHMQTSPVGLTMEALGSPMYGAGAPYWNQSPGLWQGYFGGYGAFLPQINYETFGAGFSNLPTELGGQRQQTGRSRMGGTPME